jgi:hypothetical protein
MNKLEQAARQALEALESAPVQYDFNSYPMLVMTPDTLQTTLTALREALAEQAKHAEIPEWVDVDDYEEQKQEPFDMNDHPPHRLCECRKCMEYFTPLPDCDAFAASGKPIAEQESWKCACGANLYIDFNGAPASKAEREAWSHNDMAYRPCGLSMDQEQESNSIFMEGYRIGLAEMREKCAKACEEIEQDRWNLYKGRPPYTGSESGRADPHEQGVSMGAGECAAAIRDINFEGDTGFRPVSEMIAEHKQDPKKKAAIERAELRKQVAALKAVVDAWNNVEQEPVAWVNVIDSDNGPYDFHGLEKLPKGKHHLYTTPPVVPQGEPVAWQPIETLKPTVEELDILIGDGSVLCNVLTQADGDLWWNGSGTGEKFIDPEYADVTHWRKHSDTTPPSVEAAIEATKEKAAKVCEAIRIERIKSEWDAGHETGCSSCAAAIRSMK